jgi:hypothetical protein
MFKAGITNREKNQVRTMHMEGKTTEQISALLRLRPQHVRAVTERLDKEGVVMYISGKPENRANAGHGSGAGEVQLGEPGQQANVSPQDAQAQVTSALESENEAMRKELEELREKQAEEAAQEAQDEEQAEDEPEVAEAEDPAEDDTDAPETPVQRRRRRKAATG